MPKKKTARQLDREINQVISRPTSKMTEREIIDKLSDLQAAYNSNVSSLGVYGHGDLGASQCQQRMREIQAEALKLIEHMPAEHRHRWRQGFGYA
jgi:hypothetical protein